jgi:hypothetical protein
MTVKRCPFCAEVIRDAAIVGRYCGRDLAPATTPSAQSSPPVRAYRMPWSIKILIGIVGVAVLGALFENTSTDRAKATPMGTRPPAVRTLFGSRPVTQSASSMTSAL